MRIEGENTFSSTCAATLAAAGRLDSCPMLDISGDEVDFLKFSREFLFLGGH